MNWNELARRAHENAVRHGFWDEKRNPTHCLMLAITEVAEMVEAHRKGRRADRKLYEWALKAADKEFDDNNFEGCIKDSVEDELADVAIRLFDLAGAMGVDFEMMKPCRYFRAYGHCMFTENAFGLVKGLTRENFAVEKRIQFGIAYLEGWARSLKVDLDWHVEQKMRYNAGRPVKHGKEY